MSDQQPAGPNDDFAWSGKNALTVTFILTLGDVFTASIGPLYRQVSTKLLLVLVAFMVIVTVVTTGIRLHRGQNVATDPWLWIMCLTIGLAIYFIALVPTLVWFRSRAFVRQNRLVQGPQTIAIGDDGVTVVSEVSRTEFRWTAFVKIVETDEAFLCFLSGDALVLPLRALPDPDDRHELRQLVRGGLGDLAQLRHEQWRVAPPHQVVRAVPDQPAYSRRDDGFPRDRNNTVRATFTLGTWDIFRVSYTIIHSRPAVWILHALLALAVATAVVVSLATADVADPDDWIPFICLTCTAFGFVGVICSSFLPIIVWLRSRAVVRAPSNKGPQRFVADVTGITITTAVSHARMQWRAFAKVVETKRDFLIYFSQSRATPVPRRALPDPAERHRLREFIRAGLGDKAYLRSD